MYVDVYVGSQPKYLMAVASPSVKSGNCKRYKISVQIPDEAFSGEVDKVLPVDEVVEVDE